MLAITLLWWGIKTNWFSALQLQNLEYFKKNNEYSKIFSFKWTHINNLGRDYFINKNPNPLFPCSYQNSFNPSPECFFPD